MANDLVLVRHGESEHHVKGLTGGWTDAPLTEVGRKQAELTAAALARHFHDKRPRLFSSDLLRAKETAAIISKPIGIQPVFCIDLRELNNGIAKDKTVAEAQLLLLPQTKPTVDWTPYPEAESWRAMSRRVSSFIERMAEESADEAVLIVSHGNALIPIVHWWLRLEERHWSTISFQFDCGSITRLTSNEWVERVIAKLNDTSHLEELTKNS